MSFQKEYDDIKKQYSNLLVRKQSQYPTLTVINVFLN